MQKIALTVSAMERSSACVIQNVNRAPWLALDYGEGAKVSVEKVVLLNRVDCCGDRTKNVEIRL